MDRSYMLNDYVSQNEENLNERNQAEDYLNGLKNRIRGTKSIDEVKNELNIFLDKYSVKGEIRNDLLKIVNDINETTDLYDIQRYLENYLSEYLEKKEKYYQESNQEVIDIKQEKIDEVTKRLDSVGINLTGNQDEILDSITTEDDIYKLDKNVDNAVEYFEERKDTLGDTQDIEPIDISINTIDDAINSSNEDTILDTALERQENDLDTTTVSDVSVTDNGTVEIEGDSNRIDSMNFVAMMATYLVASNINNNTDISENLDMRFLKNKEDISKFKVTFGNFPINANIKNKLDPVLISRINECVKTYNAKVNYFDTLNMASPEVATALKIINNHVLGEKGYFGMAVKNGGISHDIGFVMDENYDNIANNFPQDGIRFNKDTQNNSQIMVKGESGSLQQGNQLLTLVTTLEALDKEKLQTNSNTQTLNNNYQKVLDYKNPNNLSEVAHVSGLFLTVVEVTEIILLALYFAFIFTR